MRLPLAIVHMNGQQKGRTVSMSYFQPRTGAQSKEQAGASDWGFVAFVIVITALAFALTLIQIYLQNPK